jgi:lysyl-tRNA synthetase class 2
MNWQPTANLDTIRQRAYLYNHIRKFFAERQVLEVETPILSGACVPDVNMEPIYTDKYYLQTSPELAMKRLLASGSGAIFQITKAFRDAEIGRWHNPEFSILEWYRPGFKAADLIGEIDELLQSLLKTQAAERISYCAAFQKYTGLDALDCPILELEQYCAQLGFKAKTERDTYLQFIFSQQIETQLNKPTVITDFPASQAALARKRADNPKLAERFEFYIEGIELANGFYELTDPIEQRQRFEQDLAKRQKLNLPLHPIDERFLAALEAGLPECSGVALGLDRLLMLIMGVSDIKQVLTFPIDQTCQVSKT